MIGWRTGRFRLGRRDFLEARRSGKRLTGRYFVVLIRKRNDGGGPRLGITVTRKVGSAVLRNRIKRLVREWFRHDGTEIGACDVVVIAKNLLPSRLTAQQVGRDLSETLSAEGLTVGRFWWGSCASISAPSPPCSAPPAASTPAAPSTRSK